MSRDPADATSRLRRAAGGKSPSRQSSRRSATRAGVFFALAIVAAGSTLALLTRYMDSHIESARLETAKVVVAAVDLPLAATLDARALTTIDWPAASVPTGAVHDPGALIGRVLTTRLVKGEPVLVSRLAAKDAGSGLAAVLPPDMRAVAVRVDDVVGVAGFIHPGDSVDVIVTMKPTERAEALPTAKVILQNVRVLAVGKQLEADAKSKRTPTEATVATLMVDSVQAEKLALASSKGKLLLALRSLLDSGVVDTPGSVPPSLLGESPAPAAPPERRASNPRPRLPPPEEKEVVEILRGRKLEQRSFGEGSGRP